MGCCCSTTRLVWLVLKFKAEGFFDADDRTLSGFGDVCVPRGGIIMGVGTRGVREREDRASSTDLLAIGLPYGAAFTADCGREVTERGLDGNLGPNPLLSEGRELVREPDRNSVDGGGSSRLLPLELRREVIDCAGMIRELDRDVGR